MNDSDVLAFESVRALLFSIAYRMLGSVSDADDVVQDTFIRWHTRDPEVNVSSPKAYLVTTATRLAIDHLRSARTQRQHYVGTWLPEPLIEDPAEPVAEAAAIADSLSLAFLTLLEALSPVERAVFILREVFQYDYEDVARIVGRTRDNCRQLLRRARERLAGGERRFQVEPSEGAALARGFFKACQAGDLAALEELLIEDVLLYGDGGGRSPSWSRPIAGRDQVARLLVNLGALMKRHALSIDLVRVNGGPVRSYVTESHESSMSWHSRWLMDGSPQCIQSSTPTS